MSLSATLSAIKCEVSVGSVLRPVCVSVTPGVALGILGESKSFPFDVVIIDEYHERTMELDLLLALCLRMGKLRLAVMSATIDGERIAHHVNGVHVEAKGRSFPLT